MEYKMKVKEFLSKFFGSHSLDENEDIFASGFVNSLFAMQLVMFIEKEFNIRVENEDLDLHNFRTLNAIDKFITDKIIN